MSNPTFGLSCGWVGVVTTGHLKYHIPIVRLVVFLSVLHKSMPSWTLKYHVFAFCSFWLTSNSFLMFVNAYFFAVKNSPQAKHIMQLLVNIESVFWCKLSWILIIFVTSRCFVIEHIGNIIVNKQAQLCDISKDM